jgi:hypothetical protein
VSTLAEIESRLQELRQPPRNPGATVDELLRLGEGVLSLWALGKGFVPTRKKREGFRLLALHRQGSAGDPSFNACRESCRELIYYRNLVHLEPEHPQVRVRVAMARAVAQHLCLFVGGKMQDPELGDFCCSSRPLHTAA